jgi:hypothetical protein
VMELTKTIGQIGVEELSKEQAASWPQSAT